MIEVKDRFPRKPNRIKITPEDGSAPFYATWERADNPLEEGTPINKFLFDSIEEDAYYFSGVDDIEINAQKVTTIEEWTTVTFNKGFSGIPRVFLSADNPYTFAIKNITPEGCQIAVYTPTTFAGYVAGSSGGTVNKSVNIVTGSTFVATTVDLLAVYDGGVEI